MRKSIIGLLPLASCFILQGCMKDKLTRTYSILTPVYQEKAAVYANIKSNAPREVTSPGKIFIYGKYLFLNEVDKGVHIIDNSNPASPVVKAFVNIPGNLDIAVKGNTMYADLYGDLVVVDIANPLQVSFVRHITNVFPERKYANGFIPDSNMIIVDWKKKDTTIDVNAPCRRCVYDVGTLYSSGSQGATAATVGIAGSMARFSIVNNYMYTVNNRELTSFDISNTHDPVRTTTQQVGWNIETIYPFSNKLFIGSMTGMFIYDISNPATPLAQGQFSHVRRCDPVIADGSYAYVTLRTGTNCAGTTSELNVVNISNLNAAVLAKAYTMTNPHGLAKDNRLLFICDGRDGLKMYDATNPLNISLKKHLVNMETYDAIANNGNLIVVAKDGLYQYAYSFPDNLSLKSRITVSR